MRKVTAGRLQLLQADDIRPRILEPGQKVREALVDVVDVVGRDFHVAIDPIVRSYPGYRLAAKRHLELPN
jgi:hypothetical protein